MVWERPCKSDFMVSGRSPNIFNAAASTCALYSFLTNITALDRNSPHNWLDDNFWLKKAYLEWRSPLPIHSNWWLLFKEDANTPEDCVPAPADSVSDWQLARAAWLTWRTLVFRDKLQRCVAALYHRSYSSLTLKNREEIFAESTRTGSSRTSMSILIS